MHNPELHIVLQHVASRSKLLILSLCHHDVPYVVYYYRILLSRGVDVSIGTDDPVRRHSLQQLFISEIKPPGRQPLISYDPSIQTLFGIHENVLVFTLGTYEICNVIVQSLARESQILYIDCYFCDIQQVYHHRLVDPFAALFTHHCGHQLSSRFQLIKQLIKQLIYDPCRKTYYFSADSHCWLTKPTLARLRIEPSSIDYTSFRKTHLVPPKSLIFVLGVHDVLPPSIDWSFWLASGFNLYFKPHPNPSMSYRYYPASIQPIFNHVSPLSIEFTADSFMIGFFSTALGYTKQSISLFLMDNSSPHPLRLAYAVHSGHLPSCKSELLNLLKPANVSF